MLKDQTKFNFLIKTIVNFIHQKGKVTDKEIIELKKQYNETDFLISFNHLVEKGYVLNSHTNKTSNELKGEAELYELSESGALLVS